MVPGFLALIGLVSGIAVNAEPLKPDVQGQPGRWHFAVEGEPGFSYSILFSRTPAGDETRLLLQVGASRLELVSRQNPTGSDSLESVRDVATGEQFSRRLLLSGHESIHGCERVTRPDACILFEGKNGRGDASMASFSRKGAPALRARLASLVSENLMKVLFEASHCFNRVAELSSYQDDFLGLVWPERFRQSSARTLGGSRGPGCTFDASFGFPCSDRESRQEELRFGRN